MSILIVACSRRGASHPVEAAGFSSEERKVMRAAAEASDDDPDAFMAHMICGHIFNDHKQHTNAIREYEHAGRLKPNELGVHSSLAMTYELLGDTAGARRSWEATGGTNFVEIDRYLKKWDEFANGSPDPNYRIGDYTDDFEERLKAAFKLRDPRAPSRFVFSALVQIGGSIPAKDGHAKAFREMVGDGCKISRGEDGAESYFAGDLYYWWRDHGTNYPKMPLMEEWLARDYAKTVALPLYESIRGKRPIKPGLDTRF